MGPITQVIIAAGGFGTRFKPFTDTAPKPMVPILGKPLLEWHILQFKKHGVTEFFFTLHYLPQVVMDYFGDGSKWGVRINYGIEETPQGSAGGIRLFRDRLADRFFYIYGDMFSLLDYSAMAQKYSEKENPVGMQRMKRTTDYADADVAEVDTEGRFVAIHKKPHTDIYANAHRMRGVFILEKEILDFVPEGMADLAKDVLPKVVGSKRNFYAYESDDYTKGIDTVEKLREVEGKLSEDENLA